MFVERRIVGDARIEFTPIRIFLNPNQSPTGDKLRTARHVLTHNSRPELRKAENPKGNATKSSFLLRTSRNSISYQLCPGR